ncbi:GGDEF domain-containing protein [Modicisalibacter zincidurans]|uniref:diguanylate cyclase n=1 Tax=Modicisalibacter zincidurans TaxID=1178777 RepID=A0ABP9RED3_9GAMM|nr:GGDEF domain-containing protein [Halomonas zincidurans]MEA3251674.1 GGDEF domain-containing protein [Pseudomonadota bacterium]
MEVDDAREAPRFAANPLVVDDHFKRVNDTYGHLVGDEVIRALANLLRRRLRESDLIGRYGGEEFLLVLNDCEAPQAVRIIDELREAFAQFNFGKADQRLYR